MLTIRLRARWMALTRIWRGGVRQPRLAGERTWMAVALLWAAAALAFGQQPDPADNVITRTVWWLTEVALYGCGGAIALWGVFQAVLDYFSEQGPQKKSFRKIGVGLLVLAAPAILRLGIDYFNNETGVEGLLDGVRIGR